ncbi:MAG: hypothetical protein PPHEMADE_5899, partial [uncultured Paraburkholderia sp.]
LPLSCESCPAHDAAAGQNALFRGDCLDYCEIPYTGKKAGASSVERDAKQDIDVCASKAETRKATAVPEPRRASQSVRSAHQVALGQPEVVKQEPSARLEPLVQAIPAGPFLDIKQVSERVNISVSMLYEKMNPTSKYYDPRFPPKIQLTERTVRYSQVDVDAWIQACVSGPSAAGDTRGRKGARAEQVASKFPSPNNPGKNNANSDYDPDGDEDRLRSSGLRTEEIVRLFSRKARGGELAGTFSNPPLGLKRRAQISSLKGRYAYWDPIEVALWLYENRTGAYPTRVLAEIFEYESRDPWRFVWADEARKLERRRGAR